MSDRVNRAVFTNTKLVGVKELDRIMADFPAKFKKRGVKSAFQDGGKVLLHEIQRNAPPNVFDYADISLVPTNSKRAYASPYPSDIYTIAIAQPKSRLAHIFEFGTQERIQKTTGRRTGSIRPEPFMRVSVLTKGQQATKTILDKLWRNMQFIAKELDNGNNPDFRKLKSGRR
jgi:hypothetical protein